MDRSQKADSVASLNATFNEVGVVVITRNLGLTVAHPPCCAEGAMPGIVQVANSLAKLAIMTRLRGHR
jgi:large subunit ribosomal protein L10